MLFDTPHILYMIISTLAIAAALVAATLFIKSEGKKEAFLKVVAVITVVLHYSNIWVEYYGNGGSTVGLEGSHLFPIYPCHIMMWLLFITAFIKNKKSIPFTILAEFCFWGGIICATFGTVLNSNYNDNSNLADWYILKGLLSHSTLILGCIYMLVGRFIKIRMFNIVSACVGLAFFIVDGVFANWLYEVCELGEVNAMFLLYSPIESMPWLSPYIMGLMGITLMFIVISIYELHLPKEERWYFKVKIFFDKRLKKVDAK